MKRPAFGLVLLLVVSLLVGAIACGGADDTDGDGWDDAQEQSAGTNPYNVDSDGDGYWDPTDPNPLDSSIPALGPTSTLTPRATPTPTLTQTPSVTPSPTVAPTPTPAPETLPVGWTLHATDRFEIGLPESWLAFELLPETIDALIEEMGPTNPELIPFWESLKHTQGFDLWAFDLDSPPTFAVNMNVMRDIGVLPFDQYVDVTVEQLESVGAIVVAEERLRVGGDQAVLLEITMTAYYPSGDPYEVLQQMVVIEHGAYVYGITLSCKPEDADKYKELLEAILQTFNILR